MRSNKKRNQIIGGILLVICIILPLYLLFISLPNQSCEINDNIYHRNANLTYPINVGLWDIGCKKYIEDYIKWRDIFWAFKEVREIQEVLN